MQRQALSHRETLVYNGGIDDDLNSKSIASLVPKNMGLTKTKLYIACDGSIDEFLRAIFTSPSLKRLMFLFDSFNLLWTELLTGICTHYEELHVYITSLARLASLDR